MHQEIIQYLQQNKDQYSQDALVAQLRAAGHTDAAIQESVTIVYGPPAPPAPESTAQSAEEPADPSTTEAAAAKSSSDNPTEPQTTPSQVEFQFGAKVFSIIGALALILGLGFFLRYAFAEDLITETVRVIIGVVAGVALLAVGWRLSGRYRLFSGILSGTGLALLYLSLFAAHIAYDLIGQGVAFVLVSLVTAVGVVLAVRYDTVALAIIAYIGGFLTPLLLSSSTVSPHGLFGYLILLVLSAIVLTFYKQWRSVVIMTLIATWFLYGVWYADAPFFEFSFGMALSYATIFFVLFLIMIITQALRRGKKEGVASAILLSLNTVIYFFVSYDLFNTFYDDLMSVFAALLGFVHIFIGLVIGRRTAIRTRLFQTLIGIGLLLLVLVIPLVFDYVWVTIGWALQGVVLAVLAAQWQARPLRLLAVGLLGLVFLRLIFVDSFTSDAVTPFLNERMLGFVVGIAAMVGAALATRAAALKAGKAIPLAVPTLGAGAFLLIAWSGSIEMLEFFDSWALSLFWTLLSIAGLAAGLHWSSMMLRVLSLGVFFLLVCKTVFVDSTEAAFIALANGRFLAFLLAIFVTAVGIALYRLYGAQVPAGERQTMRGIFWVVGYGLLFLAGSIEIADFGEEHWLPIFWAVLSVGGVFFALAYRAFALFVVSVGTIFLAAVTVLLVDPLTTSFDQLPVINTRVMAFLSVIFGLVAIYYLLARTTFWRGIGVLRSIMVITMHIVGLVLISREVIDAVRAAFPAARHTSINSIIQTGLSVAWAVYAIIFTIFGVLNRWRISRIVALVLFGIVTFKVFLVDTAHLNDIYRFISYTVLGVILLLTGFLYNRFRDRIVHFVKDN